MNTGIYMFLFVAVVNGLVVTTTMNIIEEKANYHKGVCKICGHVLRHHDNDAYGRRMYCCDNCAYHTNISYHCVDKK